MAEEFSANFRREDKMQIDFHYYATYCAAYIAGYSHSESLEICYSAQFVDCCSKSLLSGLKAPLSAATTQLPLELMDQRKDIISQQETTRIWASFHFLPYDLNAEKKGSSRRYLNKYRLICDVNSDLLVDTVSLAKGGSRQAAGIAMHVLADTWAHRYFAGTPSLVINNTNHYFYELSGEGDECRETQIVFHHNPSLEDDIDKGFFVSTPLQGSENSIMNLGHGRAGHFPDYSFARYKYLPAWADYKVVIKDNPSDYFDAFCQMVYAMKYLRGVYKTFDKGCYDRAAVHLWEKEIHEILKKRRKDASEDWKKLGEKISGRQIVDFDIQKYQGEYLRSAKKDRGSTYLGKFFLAAMAQKSMVTDKIFKSGNLLAGFSIDYHKNGFSGIRDYLILVEQERNKKAK